MRAKTLLLTCTILFLSAIGNAIGEQPESPRGPDPLDQPYVALLETLVDHVGEGRIDDAIGFLEDETSKGIPDVSRDSLKRMLSLVYGGAGKYDGCEIVAVIPISTRLHRAYAIGYHQRQPLIYTFTMYHFDQEWKIQHVTWNDKVADLADLVERTRR